MLHSRQTFADVIYHAVTRFPHRPAFIDGEDVLSYRDCEQRIASCLEYFRGALQLSPGAGIAVLSGNSPQTFVALASAVLGSFRYTPLQPAASAADHRYVLKKSRASILLYDSQRYEDYISEQAERWPRDLQCVRIADAASVMQPGCGLRLPAGVDPDSVCFVSFTGGTTGRPKGVCRSQRAQAVNALYTALEWEWPADIRFLVSTPMSHATGTTFTRARSRTQSPPTRRFSNRRWSVSPTRTGERW